MKTLSIVTPIYNEIEGLPDLVKELNNFKIKNRNEFDIEVIFVDDGSTDGSKDFTFDVPNSVHIKLARNYGQTTALKAGIATSSGFYVALMDADLQNDPNDLPAMINILEESEVDAVFGWRKNRQDALKKKFASKMASKLRRSLLKDGVKDAGCTLKVFKAECAKQIPLYGELHRFIPTLMLEAGYKFEECAVNHRPRISGKTKYGSTRILKGFLDVLGLWFRIKFFDRPLHFFGSISASMLISSLFIVSLNIYFYITKIFLFRNFLNLAAFSLFLGAIQMFSLGLILDQSSRHYLDSKIESNYRISEKKTNK